MVFKFWLFDSSISRVIGQYIIVFVKPVELLRKMQGLQVKKNVIIYCIWLLLRDVNKFRSIKLREM